MKRIQKNNSIPLFLVLLFFIVTVTAIILWARTEPASRLSAGKAYEIALENAQTACQEETKESSDCDHITLKTIDYLPDKSYSTSNPPGTWDFWFSAGEIPSLWDYTISLDLDGHVVLQESKVLQ
jgi:hypothetical protein